jgi:hypothetical protein
MTIVLSERKAAISTIIKLLIGNAENRGGKETTRNVNETESEG